MSQALERRAALHYERGRITKADYEATVARARMALAIPREREPGTDAYA